MSQDLVDASRTYTYLGWIIHPLYGSESKNPKCNSPGKQPIEPGWQKRESPRTEAEIMTFWGPNAKEPFNIGLQCGILSGVLVIDVDDWNPAIWQYLTEGLNVKDWLISKRTKGRGHIFFKHTLMLSSQKHHDLGIEILSDRSNAVLPPSRHKTGSYYRFNREPMNSEDLPEMPPELITRLEHLFKDNLDLTRIIRRCKPCLRDQWNNIFVDKGHLDYHNVSKFRGSNGRSLTLALFADMKANGAGPEVLDLACKYIFRERYDPVLSEKEIANIDAEKCWRCETIQAKLPDITEQQESPFSSKCGQCAFRRNSIVTSNSVRDPDSTVERGQIQPERYSPDIIKDAYVPENKREVLPAAKQFVKDNLMLLAKSEAEEILIKDVKEHFNLSGEELKNVVKFYREEAKRRHTKGTICAKEEDKDLDIDEEFWGLYELLLDAEGQSVRNVILYYDKIAERVLDTLNVITYKDQMYVYSDGWYQNTEEIVMKEITRIINGIRKGKFSNGIKNEAANVLHNVKYFSPVMEYPFNKENAAIPVKNGILLLDFENKTKRLIPHSPEYKFNYIIPTEYMEDADPKPIDDILHHYSPENIKELYQFPAQGILQMLRYGPFKKCYLLQGNRDAGKSSYIELIRRTFGVHNISDVSLEMLNPKENKFSLSSLEGKIFNIHDDMAYFSLKDTGTIKDLTGSYIHEVEKKGKPRYEAFISSVHCFACNRPPKYDIEVKKDIAFWERWVYVYFPNRFEKNLTFYDDNFTPENLSGFLNKILDYVLEMGHEKKLVCNYSYADVRNTWAKCADPVYRFVSENMTKAEKPMYYKKEDFLELIKNWAKDQGEDEEDIPATVTMLSQNIGICNIDTEAQITDERTGIEVRVYGIPYKWKMESVYKDKKQQVIPIKKQATWGK